MPRYLLEVPHEATPVACAMAIRFFLTSGSHFLANADWGCNDGIHKAWLTIEADSKEEARNVLPPTFRSQAQIVGLSNFTIEQVDQMLEQHSPKA